MQVTTSVTDAMCIVQNRSSSSARGEFHYHDKQSVQGRVKQRDELQRN